MALPFNLVNVPANVTLIQQYTTDDLIIDLSSVLGVLLRDNPLYTAEIALSQNTLLSTAYIPITDLTLGNNFSVAQVCGVIQDSVLDALPRGKYQITIRVTDGATLRKTFKLNTYVNLTTLV